MSDLPADPAAAVVGSQLAICQHLGVEEVVLRRNTVGSVSPGLSEPLNHGLTYHFCAGDGIKRRSEQLPPIYKSLHDEVCHYKK